MKRGAIVMLGALIAAGVAMPVDGHDKAADKAADNWPQWRGPLSTGVAPSADPPVEWSETKNVRWKVAVPGKGHSTPIIWGDKIFLTTATPIGKALPPRYSGAEGAHNNLPITHRYAFWVVAFSRRDGSQLWKTKVCEALPHEGGHETASLASASPVTDGTHVYASFGSRGLYCLDFAGDIVWKVDLGTMNTKHGHGEGSSPTIYKDSIIVNWDHESQSYVAAYNKRTGDERWKQLRNEVTSWATPIVVEHQGRAQVVVSGTGRIRGYDLETGKVIWECGGLSGNVVASPVSADGMVYAGSSYEKTAMFAIRLDGAQGDITDTDHVVWQRRRSTPYVPSPLLYRGALYFLRHYQGIMTRVVARTGAEPTGPFRLSVIRDVYASPVAAAGRIYITDLRGLTVVISGDENPQLLAGNRLDDRFAASAAVVDNEIYLRGEKWLYCIAQEGE